MKRVARLLSLMSAAIAVTAIAQSTGADAEKVKMAAFQKQYSVTKAAYAKKPKDAAAKKAFVSATVKFGTATMMTDTLPPRQKYGGALRLYREALKLDPKNAEALKNKKMIEDIYRSMGREIPK